MQSRANVGNAWPLDSSKFRFNYCNFSALKFKGADSDFVGIPRTY